MDTRAALLLIAGMGLAAYATRVPLIWLVRHALRLPPLVEHVLRCIPTAAFAAIVVPGVLAPDHGSLDVSLSNVYVYGAVAAVVSTRFSNNLLVTLLVGCGVVLGLSLAG